MPNTTLHAGSEDLQDVDIVSVKGSSGSTEWRLASQNLKTLRCPPSSPLATQLANVSVLNLSCNLLESLRGIAAFSSLQVLDASYNRIHVADINTMIDVTKLTRLCSLDLSHNEIQRMELEEFGLNSSSRSQRFQSQATRLTRLDLSFNKLVKLPDVRLAPSLQVLYLNNNRIEDLCDIENRFTLNHIHTLHLAGNRICGLHHMVPLAALAPTLRYLTISGNPFALTTVAPSSNAIKGVPPAEDAFSLHLGTGGASSCRWWRPLLLWLSPLLVSIDKVDFSSAEKQLAGKKLFREKGVLSKHLIELLNPANRQRLPKYMIQICGSNSLLPQDAEEFLCDEEAAYITSPAASPSFKAGAGRKLSFPVKSRDGSHRLQEDDLSCGVHQSNPVDSINSTRKGKRPAAGLDALHAGDERTNSELSSPVIRAVEETQSHGESEAEEEDARMYVKGGRKKQRNGLDFLHDQLVEESSLKKELSGRKKSLDLFLTEEAISSAKLMSQEQFSRKALLETGGSGSPMGMPLSGTAFANGSPSLSSSTTVALSSNIPAVIKAMQIKLKSISGVVDELRKVDLGRRAHAARVIQKYVRGMLARLHLSQDDAESFRFIRFQLSRLSSPSHINALIEGAIDRIRLRGPEPGLEGNVSNSLYAKGDTSPKNGDNFPIQKIVSEKGFQGTEHGEDLSGDLKQALHNMRNLEKVITIIWEDFRSLKKMEERERVRSAVTIQRFYRGHQARILFRTMKESYQAFVYSLSPLVEILQRCGRAMMGRRRLAREVVPQYRIQRLEEEVIDLRILLHNRLSEMDASMRKLLVPPQHREDLR